MQLLRVRPVTIYWLVFVVMSKEEGSMYRRKLHIPMVLGRMSTSSNSVEMFQHINIRSFTLLATKGSLSFCKALARE